MTTLRQAIQDIEGDLLGPDGLQEDVEVVYGPGAIWRASADGYRIGAEPLFLVREERADGH